jgi:hypothetical protein
MTGYVYIHVLVFLLESDNGRDGTRNLYNTRPSTLVIVITIRHLKMEICIKI